MTPRGSLGDQFSVATTRLSVGRRKNYTRYNTHATRAPVNPLAKRKDVKKPKRRLCFLFLKKGGEASIFCDQYFEIDTRRVNLGIMQACIGLKPGLVQ